MYVHRQNIIAQKSRQSSLEKMNDRYTSKKSLLFPKYLNVLLCLEQNIYLMILFVHMLYNIWSHFRGMACKITKSHEIFELLHTYLIPCKMHLHMNTLLYIYGAAYIVYAFIHSKLSVQLDPKNKVKGCLPLSRFPLDMAHSRGCGSLAMVLFFFIVP